MSGKPYTIQEFKMMVDYLVENKLYSEIKGRTMWVDFANSKRTTRTWQSLKEAFLKRILPDLHNPYFGLTNEQISSFRSRCDLTDKNKNKLQIQTISDDDSNSSGHDPKDNEPSNKEGETSAGENIHCSKVPERSRSSADTVILENCYESTEQIQKELESNESDEKLTKAKSFRDCITYSEPLTPMLQEVLDDFASEPEDSDREGQMEIVENVPEHIQEIPEPEKEISITSKSIAAEVVEDVLVHELDDGSNPENGSPKAKSPNITDKIEELPVANLDDEISSMVAENGTEKDDADESSEAAKISAVTDKPVAQNSETSDAIVIHDSHSDPQVQAGGLNNSNSTVDASLPNNPEALKNNKANNIDTKAKNKKAQESVEVSKSSDKSSVPKKIARKRSSVPEDNLNTIDKKKKKLDIKGPANADERVTESHLNAEAEDKIKGSEDVIKPDVIKKPWLEDQPMDLDKPSTSFEAHVVDIIETEKQNKTKESPEIKNPCLQNISLFDEEFNKTRYNMSESSDTEQNKKETQVNTLASASTPSNDVVVLKSNSSSSKSDMEKTRVPPKKKQRPGVSTNKSERDKAIGNLFGFTSGGVGAKRKHQLSRRRRTISHNTHVSHHNAPPASNSSDWTSESESEDFVSPPRSRKNRPTRKYRKPHAHIISALEEEGGLFVMYGKKIYPLVKDGKIVKNYITYLRESDSEEEENFWKQKYVEEKKKAAELKKLLEETKKPREIRENTPVTQASRKSIQSSHAGPSNGVTKEIVAPPDERKEEQKPKSPEKIKIKFTKNNEEVHLEGHWPQIHPVLEQVVQIFHKEAEVPVSENKSKLSLAERPKEPSSRSSSPIIITPVDPEIHEKVNEIEKEIFKEIEERDKEEENQPNGQANNVTKRKIGKPRKSSSSSTHSLEQQPKTSNGVETKESEENNRTRKSKAKEIENNNNNTQENLPKRQSRTPRKILNETVNINESKTMQTRRSTQKLNTSVTNEDEEVRYMLPPQNTRQQAKLANKKTKKSSETAPKILSSPDVASIPSMDSTQGYQDSDASPDNTKTRKKKRNDTSSFTIKTRNSLRRSATRKTHPYEYHNAYNDSSNSSVDVPVKVVARENSSLNSEAYRSESYQNLNTQPKVLLRQLEPIDETMTIGNDTYYVRRMESTCRDEISAKINKASTSQSCQMTSDVGSSSNISLPMSPELSIVENMSVSKEILNNVEDYPTINEMQCNASKEATNTMCSNYMLSDINFSVPLMDQECELKSRNTVIEMSIEPKSIVTESLVKKISHFNINDNFTVTDTLNKRMHDLLLESAKKIASESAQKEVSMMDVDVTTVKVQKKPRASKKRSSTPQKRKGTKKSAAPTVDPLVEEEHVEACSHSGRKSCPPLIQTNLYNDNAVTVTEEINIANLTIANDKPKAKKKKKDVIRVKIQRPKARKAAERLITKAAKNASRMSMFTDSGINDSESEIFVPANESVSLIHNHSETCLLANDCVGDSIEFVENSKSVITVGDSMQSGDNAWISRENNEEHSTSPDLFCNNAQDVNSFYNKANSDIASTSDSVYHSPLGTEVSHNSLITEDLSDESPPPAPPSKWYLLSEDDTNTNLVGAGSAMLSGGGCGSNLKQLFPVACAIPDLSTITEMSRENDSSKKPTIEDFDGLTGDDFNSLSVFDSNFSL